MSSNDLLAKSLKYTLILKISMLVGITSSAMYFNTYRILIMYLIVPFVAIGFRVVPVRSVEED